jgi:hypothetical protein
MAGDEKVDIPTELAIQTPESPSETNSPLVEDVGTSALEEDGAFVPNERPASFGPLWKEITIVLLCCCGPITQVFHAITRWIDVDVAVCCVVSRSCRCC